MARDQMNVRIVCKVHLHRTIERPCNDIPTVFVRDGFEEQIRCFLVLRHGVDHSDQD